MDYDDLHMTNTKYIDKLRELGQDNFVVVLLKKVQVETEYLESVRDIQLNVTANFETGDQM